MNNIYQLSPASATENFTFPTEFIDFLHIYPLFQQAIFENEIKMLGEEAFYKKYSQLASYQIHIGILDLDLIPGRKEIFDYYKNNK